MKHVIVLNYSKYWDIKTGVQFSPLATAAGVEVGHALTDADFSGRPSFTVLTEEQYTKMLVGGSEPAAPAMVTGDPLDDAAAPAVAASPAPLPGRKAPLTGTDAI